MGFLRGGINFKLESRNTAGSVLMIHGLFMGSWILSPIARHLNRNGFRCFGYDYPTRIRRVEVHGAELAVVLSRLPEPRLDAVTHSMGGLILRAALAHKPELKQKIGRVVMIAPPNRGSDLARRWRTNFPPAGKLVVPLHDLSSEEDSAIHSLPPLPEGIELGILAAENDHAVSVDRTRLAGERDHRILPGRHTDILFRRRTAEFVERFLRTGKF